MLIRQLEVLHDLFADAPGGFADSLGTAERRLLRSRIERCMLDLQRHLAELILPEADDHFAGR